VPHAAKKRRASQAAEKLDPAQTLHRFVTGHDFSRADKANRTNWALAPAEFRSRDLSEFQTPSPASSAPEASFFALQDHF
jgi:hypothetical protein